MTYAIRADLEERYGADELTQRESVLSAGAVTEALADADAEIDAYVGGRYAVPLSPAPANVVRIACAIARYNILGDSATERARNDYTDALRFLRDVQAGRASLGEAAVIAGAEDSATVSLTTGRDKAFTGGIQ